LKPAEKLSEGIRKEDIALSSIIEACRGSFDQLLENEDPSLLLERASKLRKYKLKIKEADGSIREVWLDRRQNFKSITRWLVLGRTKVDDPSGCFRLLENRLTQEHPEMFEGQLGKLAIEIETRLLSEIKYASAEVPVGMASYKQDEETRQTVENFLDLTFPVINDEDAAFTMLSLQSNDDKEGAKLLRDVFAWLQFNDDSYDPTGEFRLADKLIGEDAGMTEERRAKDIVTRIAGLRNTFAFFKEAQVDSDSTITSPRKERDVSPSPGPAATPQNENLTAPSITRGEHVKSSAESVVVQALADLMDGADEECIRNESSSAQVSLSSCSLQKVSETGQGEAGIGNSSSAKDSKASDTKMSTETRRSSRSKAKKNPETSTHESTSRKQGVEENRTTKRRTKNYRLSPKKALPVTAVATIDRVPALDSRESADSPTALENVAVAGVFSDSSRKASIPKRTSKGVDSLSQTAVVEHSSAAKPKGANKSSTTGKKRRLQSNGPSLVEDSLPAKRKKRTPQSSTESLTALPKIKAKIAPKAGRKAKPELQKVVILPLHVIPSLATLKSTATRVETQRQSADRESLPKKPPRRPAKKPRTSVVETTAQQMSPETSIDTAPQQGNNVAMLNQMYPPTIERTRRIHRESPMDILARMNAQPSHSTVAHLELLLHADRQDLTSLLDAFLSRTGSRLHSYNEFVHSMAGSCGVDRAVMLQRICIWLASDGQIVDSETDRAVFTAMYDQLQGLGVHASGLKMAQTMELTYWQLQENMRENNESVASGALKTLLVELLKVDFLNVQIYTLLGVPNNPNYNQLPFAQPGRLVTPREAPSPAIAPVLHSPAHDRRRLVTLDPYVSNIASPAPFFYR
jgi:hypothetical protein